MPATRWSRDSSQRWPGVRCIPTYLARRCPHHLASLASRPKCVVSIEKMLKQMSPACRSFSIGPATEPPHPYPRARKSILTLPYRLLLGRLLPYSGGKHLTFLTSSLSTPLTPPTIPFLTARSKKVSCTHCSSGVLTGIASLPSVSTCRQYRSTYYKL